ncbi:MAG: hypothetical protein ACP6IP_03200 [Candidatus Njordarchaeia archaeon]
MEIGEFKNKPRDNIEPEEIEKLIVDVEKTIEKLDEILTGILEIEIRGMLDLSLAENMVKMAKRNLGVAEKELRSALPKPQPPQRIKQN